MQIVKFLNVRIFLLVLVLVVLRVPAEESGTSVTLNSVAQHLTEVKYRLTLLEFKNNLVRFLKNAKDNEFLIAMQVNPTYINNITLKFIEPLYNILDSYKSQIHAEIMTLKAKTLQPKSEYNKVLHLTTLQDIDRDWKQLSADATSIIQSIKNLNSVLQSIKKHISLNQNTLNYIINNFETRSELIYTTSQELEQARKRLEQISTDPSKIMIKHPRSNHMLIESILEEQKNLQLEREEIITNCSEYGKDIDNIAEEIKFAHNKIEHMLRTVEQFHLEQNTAIRRRENLRTEIMRMSKIIEDNKKEIQILHKQRETRLYNIIKEELVALQQEIAIEKEISAGEEVADTSLKNILQEISDLQFLTHEEAKKLLEIPEEMKCVATLQPSDKENSSVTLTLLQSGMCSRE